MLLEAIGKPLQICNAHLPFQMKPLLTPITKKHVKISYKLKAITHTHKPIFDEIIQNKLE